MRIKVLTYNIHKGFNGFGTDFILHEIRHALKETQCDILFLQEVVGENNIHKKKIRNWPTQTQFEFLAHDIWPHFSYGKNAVFSERHHGNAVLSKFPIMQTFNLNISNHKLEQRGLQHCEIQIDPRLPALNIFNTHIDLLSSGRKKQIEKIIAYINTNLQNHSPFIFCGDFNDWPVEINDWIFSATQAKDAHTTLYGRPAKSFPNFFPLLSLDRIYLRNIKPLEVKVLNLKPWSRLSDHLPMLAELDLDW